MSSKKPVAKAHPAPKGRSSIWMLWVAIGVIVIAAAVLIFVYHPFGIGASVARSTPTLSVPANATVEEAYYLYSFNAAFFLDVRSTKDWKAYHIDPSTSIPLDQLSNHLAGLPKNEVIVVVDYAGEAAPQAREILLKNGFTSVTVMQGGMDEWVQHLYPFIGTAPY